MERVLDFAAGQHGFIALEQLRRFGVTRARLRRLVATGQLVAVAPRVYATATPAPGFEAQLTLGLLTLGADAVVSHLAAASLHGLVDAGAPPEFTVPRARRNAVCPFAVHATDSLAAADLGVVAGFACTSVVRTILDLAATELAPTQLEAVFGRAVATGRCTREELADAIDRRRGRGTAGTLRLGAVLGDAEVCVGRRFLAALRGAGLPQPDRVEGPGLTFRFADWDVTVTLGRHVADWTGVARVVRTELVAAGWPRHRHACVA